MTSLTNETVTVPVQLSDVEIRFILGTGTSELELTVIEFGQVILGGVRSFTVIIWVHVAVLPQRSVALYVRVIVYLFAQVCAEMTSPKKVTITVPEQLSEEVTKLLLAAGTSELQLTVIALGQVILGGVISLTVIIWVQVAEFPQISVAL